MRGTACVSACLRGNNRLDTIAEDASSIVFTLLLQKVGLTVVKEVIGFEHSK